MILNPAIFRTYDIRAIAETDLNNEALHLIGRGIAHKLRSLDRDHVVVGRDGRLSSPRIHKALIKSLRAHGINVTDIGIIPTPVLYFATKFIAGVDSGIMITASHNPPEYNGIKFLLADRVLSSEEITELYHLSLKPLENEKQGKLIEYDTILEDYANEICKNIHLNKPLKLIVDYSNGATTTIMPELFKRLGCEVIPLFDDLDGNFPNHEPEPTQPKNLKDIMAALKAQNADCGIAFDGDGDRVVCLTPDGEMVHPDRILTLLAQDILKRHPGAPIVFDVKCSHQLPNTVKKSGGKPIMSPTGHTLIKRLAKQENAILAGEMSGHFVLYDRWYDFDDGMYAALRVLELISNVKPLAEFLADLPEQYATPEIQLKLSEAEKIKAMQTLKNLTLPGAEASHIDGIRLDFKDGFALVRASNTTPCLVLRFAADTNASLTNIKNSFLVACHQLCPNAGFNQL